MNSLSFLRGPLLGGRAVGFGFINASKLTANNPSLPLARLPSQFRRALSSIHASDEEASARAAALNADSEAPTIFDKIITKEIPSTIVYEDEKVLAFRDISPQAPVHVLVIPKLRDGLSHLGKADQRHGEILGHLLYAAKIVAEKEGIIDGFRVVINSGPSAYVGYARLHHRNRLGSSSSQMLAALVFITETNVGCVLPCCFLNLFGWCNTRWSIRVPSPLTCAWRETDEMASWVIIPV